VTGDRLGVGSQLFGVGPTCEVAGLDCESTQVGYPIQQGNHVVTGGVDALRGGCGGCGGCGVCWICRAVVQQAGP
jgi:hypothetical protein